MLKVPSAPENLAYIETKHEKFSGIAETMSQTALVCNFLKQLRVIKKVPKKLGFETAKFLRKIQTSGSVINKAISKTWGLPKFFTIWDSNRVWNKRDWKIFNSLEC